MLMSQQLRKMAKEILRAMADNRQVYQNRLEHGFIRPMLHFYYITLAKKIGISESNRSIVRWTHELEGTINNFKSYVAHSIVGNFNRRTVYEKAKNNTIKHEEKKRRNPAKKKIIDTFGKCPFAITDEDMKSFWTDVIDPAVEEAIKEYNL